MASQYGITRLAVRSRRSFLDRPHGNDVASRIEARMEQSPKVVALSDPLTRSWNMKLAGPVVLEVASILDLFFCSQLSALSARRTDQEDEQVLS